MKKLIFTLLACVVGCLASFADTQTYVMTSYDGNKKTVTDDQNGVWNLSTAASSSNQLPANPSTTSANDRGVCINVNNATMTSATSFERVTEIKIELSTNNASNTISVSVGGTNIGSTVKPGKLNHTTATFKSENPLSGEIQIKFGITGNSVWIGAVTVTTQDLAPGEKKNAGLAFNPTSVVCWTNEKMDVTFTKATDGAVSFATSDANVAEYADGVLTAHNVGTCTITATSAETDEYAAGTATLSVTVSEKPAAKMLVAEQDGIYYAMSCEAGSANKSLSAVPVTVSNGKVLVTSENVNLLWNIEGNAIQSVALSKANKDSYISFNKADITFTADAPNVAWSVDATDGYLVSGTGNSARAFIVRANAYFKTYVTSNINNTSDNPAYGSAAIPMDYAIVPTVTIAAGDYASFSSDKDIVIPEGLEVYYMSAASATEATLTKLEGVIPANEGVIFKNAGEEEATFFLAESDEAAAAIENLLAPTTGESVEAGNYILAQPEGKAIGFYPLEADYALPAGHAYLPKANVPDAGAAAIKINFGATGVNDIKADIDGDGQIYNIMGQKVNANYKGIVIINGKKYINK